MRIAFIGYENLADPLLWAGIPYSLFNNLKSQTGVEIEIIAPTLKTIRHPILVILKRLLYNKILAYRLGVYRFDREEWFINLHSREINEKLADFDPDIILCCTAYQVNKINTDKPIFIYTDATFKLLNTYYTDYRRYAKVSVKHAELAERIAFQKASGLFFSSNWAKQSSINDYRISENKTYVIPFGSNLTVPSDHQLNLIKKIDKNNFSLVFVGFDYERKGLAKAVKIHQELIFSGVNSQLTVIGPSELDQRYNVENVNFLGKIDKQKPIDCEKLLKAYDSAHFLILPTQVEAFGIVFCEAASLAVPAITHAVGGTDEIIKNNINGIKLPLESETNLFVKEILFYIKNDSIYQSLRKSTYQEYCKRLNWESTVKQMLELFNLASGKS